MPTEVALPIKLIDILVPDVFIGLENAEPHVVYARVLGGDDATFSIKDITRARLLFDAGRAAAHLCRSGCEPRDPGTPVKTIAFLARSSYLFYVYEIAALLLGLSPMLLSLKNSVAATGYLLRTSQSKFILINDAHSQELDELANMIPGLTTILMTDIDSIHDKPYRRPTPTLDQTMQDIDRPAIFMHTSGSTGFPKLISLPHRSLVAAMRGASDEPYAGVTLYTPFPLFHALGIYLYIIWPLGSGCVPTIVNTAYPANENSTLAHIKRLLPCLAFIPAAILEDISVSGTDAIETLKRAKRVFYGGAPLRPSSGDFLARNGVPLVTSYGMTEIIGVTRKDFPSEDLAHDWSYVRFNKVFDLRFLPVDDHSDLRELVVLPHPDASPAAFNCQDPLSFRTNDVWAPHPTRPDLWKHMGRKDSLIVLSNGLKTNAKQIELLLLRNSDIARVVVFGAGRFLVGKVWPTIEHLNTVVQKHSRLLKEMVLVQHPTKPFLLTDKSSIKVKDTISLYSAEIDTAYASLGANSTLSVSLPFRIDLNNLIPYLCAVITRLTGKELNGEANLFENGVDSLQAIAIRSEMINIIHRMAAAADTISPLVVYENPSINQLASFLFSWVSGSETVNYKERGITRIKSYIKRYSSDLPQHHADIVSPPVADGAVILLTGSTGSLGSHVLASIVKRDDVRRVYCFSRVSPTSDNLEKHLDTFSYYGLDTDILRSQASKLEFLSVDLSISNFGLPAEIITRMQSEVTHIIHNAWQMNFNLDLENFAVDLAGLQHLAAFALCSFCATPPKFIFLSSVASVLNFPSEVVPEDRLVNHALAANLKGYGQAKYVAERVLDRAAQLGLAVAVVRGGQISGNSKSGAWNAAEHIPILLHSSIQLGFMPEHFPDIRWLPVDVAAEILLDVSFSDRLTPSVCSYWHLENPHPIPWSDLVDRFVDRSQGRVSRVASHAWLELVRNTFMSSGSVPAVKLLEFYATKMDARPVVLDSTRMAGVSPHLACAANNIRPALDRYVDFALSQ